MIKKIFILICIICLFQTYVEANTVVINLRVTMPCVISENMDNKIESLDDETDKIVIFETAERNGESIIVKTIVAK